MTINRSIRFALLGAVFAAACYGQVSINANATLDGAAVGMPYSVNLFPVGGAPPYAFTLVSGAIPAGLTLSPAGVLSGTPTAAGTGTFTVMAQDSLGASAVKAFTLPVSAAPLTLAPAAGTLPNATAGQVYVQNFVASGGSGSYRYLLLPTPPLFNNLDLDPLTGAFYGTPSTAGPLPFSVEVIDSNNRTVTQAYNVNVLPQGTLAIGEPCATLPALTPGAYYSAQLVGTGGEVPYTFGIFGSALPPGLSITEDGFLHGVVAPSTVFFRGSTLTAFAKSFLGPSFSLPVTLTDPFEDSASRTCTLPTVGSDTFFIVSPSPLPDAVTGMPYSFQLYTSSGSANDSFSATGLPAWLTLNSAGGLSGTPPSTGTFSFVVTAISGFDQTSTAQQTFMLTVDSQGPAITTASPLPDAYQPRFYSQTIAFANAPGGTLHLQSGNLPVGLALIGQQIIGTPFNVGTYTFTLELDLPDSRSVAKTFSLTVRPGAVFVTTPSPLPPGVVGASYLQVLQATPTGGSPYIWRTMGNPLPPGLSVNGGGALAGFPTAPYNNTFTAVVSGDANSFNTKDLQLTIRAQALTIATASVPPVLVGAPYAVPIQVIGGAGPPYSLSVTAGALPPGISLVNGSLTGAPTMAGAFTFTLTATDSDQSTASRTYMLAVAVPPFITAPALPAGTVGAAYPGAQYVGGGGTPPYQFSIASGALPGGLTLNAVTGLLSGTPTAAGTFQFVVRLIDSLQAMALTPTQTVVIRPPALTITAPALPAGTVGVVYAGAQYVAGGGTPPYQFSIASGALPAGLVLNAGSGALSGTPTTAGAYQFVVRLTDSAQVTILTQTQSLLINPPALTITAPVLPAGTVGVAYPGAQYVAGGGTPPYQFSIASGQLPPGLVLNAGSGALSGLPTAAGTYQFVVRLTDSAQMTILSQPQSLVINPPVLIITGPALPVGTVGVAYPGAQYVGHGGTPPYQFAIAQGQLPTGLVLNAATGVLSGVPTTAGFYQFVVRLSDARDGLTVNGQTLTVDPSLLNLAPANLLPGTVGTTYATAPLAASGGTPPYVFTVSAGALPAGLTLSGSGIISGVPSFAGQSSFTVRVTDSLAQSATAQLQISISQPITITPSIVPAGTVGVAYAPVQFSAGGGGGFSFSIGGGTLPPGLALTTSGVLQGTPSSAGAFTFTVSATGPGGIGSGTITMRVYAAITLGPITIPPIDPNTPTQVPIQVSGGTPPYTFTLGGCVVPGLTLSAAGVFSGAATTPGTYTCTVTVIDSNGATTSVPVTITVLPVLTLTTATLPSGVLSSAYQPVTLGATGGKAPYTFSVTGGALPPGLTLSPSGTISGTPTSGGVSNFTLGVTDASGATATAAVSITVIGGPTIGQPQFPDGVGGAVYSPITLTVSGGTAPYTFTVSGGSLPPGLSLTPAGVVTGTPSQVGAFNFTIQVTDANKLSASASFSIRVAAPTLTIPAVTLTAATVGSAYSQTLTVSGGVGPYTWQVVSGALPDGLTLSPSGVLSGMPTANGTFNFTVQATDSEQPGMTATQAFAITAGLPPISAVSIQGLPSTIDAAQQPTFSVSLASAYPVAITGTLTLTFASSAVAPGDDPSIKFMNGGRTVNFTIPAGQTSAVFPVPQILSSGTVAGTITITATLLAGQTDITPAPAPTRTIVVNAAPPVITSVTVTNAGGQLTVVVQGFATTRQVTQAKFHFTPTGAATLQSGDFTVDVNSAFTQWYQSAAAAAFGSAFTYTQPFTFQGQVAGSLTVTLTNDKGSSNAGTGQF